MSESMDKRTEFGPVANEYRRKSSLLKWLGVPAVAFWILIWFPKTKSIGFTGCFLSVLTSIIASLLWLPKLICPGCQRKLEEKIDQFCPECGKAAIGGGRIFPKCTACDKPLRRGRGGRRYKIRYCTWCGAHVADEGI
jgi:hypothetical protein